tara:strand:- start:3338 stop:4129 length:792 start_codon:yes stop_codon:yes gene_type:complete
MKIIAFTQLRNELTKGNLENWFKCTEPCDYRYIFDQDSTDGSKEYYKKFDNTVVIESPTNRFKEELICKQELMDKLLIEHPDVDWVLWLDGDLLLDGRLLDNNGQNLRGLCDAGMQQGIEAFFFGHYNLWRSDIHYRLDEGYHGLHGQWCPLWRNTGRLKFDCTPGLHKPQYPLTFRKVANSGFNVVHRGFATDSQIITKYDTYKGFGQKGWDLDRLLDEKTLDVTPLEDGILPSWFNKTDIVDPREKKKIIKLYEEKQKTND